MERNCKEKMDEHKIFKTAAIPVILMIIGLNHWIKNLLVSVIAGIGIYAIVFFKDRFLKNR